MKNTLQSLILQWSGRHDLNVRPPVPQANDYSYKTMALPTFLYFFRNVFLRCSFYELEVKTTLERHLDMVEVVGSTPISPTIFPFYYIALLPAYLLGISALANKLQTFIGRLWNWSAFSPARSAGFINTFKLTVQE